MIICLKTLLLQQGYCTTDQTINVKYASYRNDYKYMTYTQLLSCSRGAERA